MPVITPDSEQALLIDALPILAPSPVPVVELGEILGDSLFGDVIEMADLIPHLLGPEPGGHEPPADSAPAVVETGGEGVAASLPFAILFEDDGSSGHGAV
ncbi:hypothetical protein PV773_22275 [Mesorhizobium sp. CC13]|uniref:hypothetical protein n=1 Tax=Mesorhizobium sp. CC13 TaxID=3029194 RepID=UPI003267AD8F